MQLRHGINVVTALLPKDITGAAQVGQRISLKNYRYCTIVITQGAWAGGTPAVTIQQATSLTGGTPKALSFTKRYQQATNVGTGYVETAVVSDTFNLPATANQNHIIEIDAASLDVDNGYDCIQVNIGTPGVFADVLSVVYLLYGARYADNAMPNPFLD
jgi:hypothetical protein